jgi:neutral ceramidase
MIKCGMSEVVITPPLGLPIPGYFQQRPASGVKDELYAKAMVVDDGRNTAALVVIDAIGIEKEEVQRIRERVNVLTGIPGERVMVSATHTHTGGPVYKQHDFRDEEYVALLVRKSADAVALAMERSRPARIGFSVGEAKGISFNRRYVMKDGSIMTNPGILNPQIDRPSGPIDPAVTVMRIDDLEGSPMGVLTNFACHADTVGGRRFSGDYPGELSRVLKRILGQDTVSLFSVGACGDINHINIKRDKQLSASQIGTILAGEVLKVREQIDPTDTLTVNTFRESFLTGVRQPREEDVEEARQLLDFAARNPDQPVKPADLFFARQALILHDRNECHAEIEVQVLQIGDLAVVGVPCELFVEYGLEIKEGSRQPYTIINTFANGVNGYVPRRQAFAKGGYETRLTSRTRLMPDAGEKMVSTALKMLNSCISPDGSPTREKR